MTDPRYAELAVTTNFSFLRGASHPEEMVAEAARLGLAGVSVTDRNSLAGVVRGHMAAKEAGVAYAPGCRLVFSDGTPDILVWPEDRPAHGRLCELLTAGKRRAPKGECHLGLDDLAAHGGGLVMAVMTPQTLPQREPVALEYLRDCFGDYVYLAASRRFAEYDQRCLAGLGAMAKRTGAPLLAVGDALYHRPERRFLQDVVSCIREHVSLREAGRMLEPNAERHLRDAAEMTRLFKGYEEAVARTVEVFSRLHFSVDDLKYQYPEEPTGSPLPPQKTLEKLTAEGLAQRYPHGAPRKVLKAIDHELDLIGRLEYAPYFLTVYDIVRFARSQNILCQGRGSAANSAVCYCLGITEVDPEKTDLLFERFISEERNEPPDIDVDFEHERREEVIQYIYEKYGREHAGLAATVVSYRGRSAVREVGKVFGLSDDTITAISGVRWGSSSSKLGEEDARRAGLDPDDRHLMQALDLASQLIGFPRHLSQHVGGFVITRDRLSSVIPIENAAMEGRTVVEWDKDDLECAGILKIDVLALGMLSCVRKALELLRIHYGRQETLASLPDGDRHVYDMICEADTVGVFQIESRAQMSMLPRLRPRCYYDLVIEVAIVRPGPIQGDMVHPYLRRRQGKEEVSYPKKELEGVLAKTLGVPLFQEQAMNIAIVAAGFTPGEADKLRRAMATFRRVGTIHSFRAKMVEGMVANGYEQDFAEHCFSQIEGFGEYGFPESHAASFALLVYVSCWLKCYYPDVFCAAILNAQPMGFYAPAQLIRDAREHGVAMRCVDVNHSDWLSTLEDCTPAELEAAPGAVSRRFAVMKGVMKNTHAVRLGLHQIKGFGEENATMLIDNRGRGYDSVRDLWMRSGLPRRAIQLLAEADAFSSLGLSRRDALWAVRALDPLGAAERLPLFAISGQNNLQKESEIMLPPMPLGEQVLNDYRSLTYSLRAHPVSFVRPVLEQKGYRRNGDLQDVAPGRFVTVAGLVLVRQRPGSANGVVFETIEDETGVANAIVWPKVFERYRTIVLGSRFVGICGPLQSQEGVIHVVARQLLDLTPLLASLADLNQPVDGLARADEVRRQQPPRKTPRGIMIRERVAGAGSSKNLQQAPNRSILPKGRNFH